MLSKNRPSTNTDSKIEINPTGNFYTNVTQSKSTFGRMSNDSHKKRKKSKNEKVSRNHGNFMLDSNELNSDTN